MTNRSIRKKVKEKTYSSLFPVITPPENHAPKTTEDDIIKKRDDLQRGLEEIEEACQKEGYNQERREQIERIRNVINKINQQLKASKKAAIAFLRLVEKELEEIPQESNLDEEKQRNDQLDSKVLDMPKSNQTPEDALSETLPTSPHKEKKWTEEIELKREPKPKPQPRAQAPAMSLSQVEDIIVPILERVTQIKEQAERELKTALSPIRNVVTLYLLWKADPDLRPIISHQLKAIYSNIPNDATASFNIKTSKGIKYLDVRWWKNGEGVEHTHFEYIHIGRLDNFEKALGLEPNATIERNWAETTKLKDVAQKSKYKKSSF